MQPPVNPEKSCIILSKKAEEAKAAKKGVDFKNDGLEWPRRLMGIYNRDYMRDGYKSGPQITGPKKWSALTWLVVANVVAYIAQHWFIQPDLVKGQFPWGALTRDAILKGHVHTILTNFFIHADGWHLIFNMILLIVFGRFLQNSIGPRRFLKLYFFAGIVAGLGSLGIQWAQNPSMVGASGAVMAIAVATCFAFGEMTVRLLFPPISVKMRYVGYVLIGIDVARLVLMIFTGKTSVTGSETNIGVVAHLIGAAIGYFFVKMAMNRPVIRRKKKPQQRLKKKKPLSKDVDTILEKISAEGFQSLTKEEKQILDNRSEELSDNAK